MRQTYRNSIIHSSQYNIHAIICRNRVRKKKLLFLFFRWKVSHFAIVLPYPVSLRTSAYITQGYQDCHRTMLEINFTRKNNTDTYRGYIVLLLYTFSRGKVIVETFFGMNFQRSHFHYEVKIATSYVISITVRVDSTFMHSFLLWRISISVYIPKTENPFINHPYYIMFHADLNGVLYVSIKFV